MKSAVRPALFRYAIIDEKLKNRSWPNASTLARELEVTPRTIHRDLDFLRDQLHAPIVFDSRKNGYCYSESSYQLPYFPISEGEYVALFLAERLLQQYRSTPFAVAIARLFKKVTNLLTETITIDLQHINEAISFRQQAADLGEVKQFEQLHRAIKDRRQLEIAYWIASRDDTGERIVDPYHLVSLNGDWFLIAFCHRRKDVLMFVPSRIRELRETGATFNRPTEFCINDYLDVGFGNLRGTGPPQAVRLRFAPQSARYVAEKEWHPTQKLRHHADGSLTLTFRVNNLLGVKRWVLSFGADCEVLGPKELQKAIADEARKILNQTSIA